MHLKSRLLAFAAAGGLAAAGVSIAVPTLALAGPSGSSSGNCNDNVGDESEVPIVTTPVLLALEIGSSGNPLSGHVALCWSTTPENNSAPEVSGGYLALDAPGFGAPGTVTLTCAPDPNTPVAVSCNFFTAPTASVSGSNLTFTVPFSLCAGVGACPTVSNPGTPPYTTGAIVGSVTQVPAPPGGQSAAYQLSQACAYVDGTQVGCLAGPTAGVTSGGVPGTYVSSGGPCVNTLCLPINNTTVEVGSAQEALIYIPGIASPIPVSTGEVCYRSSTSAPSCP